MYLSYEIKQALPPHPRISQYPSHREIRISCFRSQSTSLSDNRSCHSSYCTHWSVPSSLETRSDTVWRGAPGKRKTPCKAGICRVRPCITMRGHLPSSSQKDSEIAARSDGPDTHVDVLASGVDILTATYTHTLHLRMCAVVVSLSCRRWSMFLARSHETDMRPLFMFGSPNLILSIRTAGQMVVNKRHGSSEHE